jgi:hypothetical protein
MNADNNLRTLVESSSEGQDTWRAAGNKLAVIGPEHKKHKHLPWRMNIYTHFPSITLTRPR